MSAQRWDHIRTVMRSTDGSHDEKVPGYVAAMGRLGYELVTAFEREAGDDVIWLKRAIPEGETEEEFRAIAEKVKEILTNKIK